MEKSRIIEVLSEWNPWNRTLKTGIKRPDYLKKLNRLHSTGQIVTITGVRRAGKSTLMRQYITEIAEKKNSDSILYVNFEEPAFSGADLPFLMKIYEAYREFINPKGETFLFLDEVHKVKGWEKLVRSLHEKGEAAIFVSGSTGNLISKEYGTLLTGRHVDMTVYPFDFKEFLEIKGIKGKKEILLRKNEVLNHLTEYLKWGGFPKVVLSDEKRILLSTYFNDVITRDIVERYNVREADRLRELARYYISNISSLQSFNRISKPLRLSVDTTERFSSYLTEVSLLFFVRRFSYSLYEQSVNPRKVYSVDTGFREAIGFKFSGNIGKLMENIVALKLLREGREFYYWKSKGADYEVDFVLKEGNKITDAIQVSFGKAEKREERSFKKIEKEHSPDRLKLIGWELPKTEYEGIPLWKWLLDIQ